MKLVKNSPVFIVHVFDENGQREALGEDKIANHNGVADATRE